MNPVAMIIGYVTLSMIAGALMVLAMFIVGDAIQCGRFVWRIWQSARGEEIVTVRWLFLVWLRYWIGIDRRPLYLVLSSNNETIYWPGHEGSRRYPG